MIRKLIIYKPLKDFTKDKKDDRETYRTVDFDESLFVKFLNKTTTDGTF